LWDPSGVNLQLPKLGGDENLSFHVLGPPAPHRTRCLPLRQYDAHLLSLVDETFSDNLRYLARAKSVGFTS